MKQGLMRTKFLVGTILSGVLLTGTISNWVGAQNATPPGPLSQPNVKLSVERQSGNCPQSVGLWWFVLPYEGGAEHTVALDTRAFADSSKQVSATKQTVEFVAPLRANYVSCVGQTRGSSFPWYRVQFKNKQAYFQVDLKKTNAPYTAVAYSTVAASRPFVRWAIAD